MNSSPTVLRSSCGIAIELDAVRYRRDADATELHLLDTLLDPVIDVGCGPGRIVGALAAGGRTALGVDVSTEAVNEARRRGAPVLGRSVFEPLPGERRWASVVLFDGNIGIGGNPVTLLRRIAELLAPGGMVLTEIEPPGVASARLRVRVERQRTASAWFEWARVSADDIANYERAAGLRPLTVERHGDRWFSRATTP